MFAPRITMPEKNNRYYIAKSEGGLNPCIPRPAGSKLRFANCVFYAVGRYAELWGVWLPSTNAENFVNAALDRGLCVSQTPAPGAVAVWAKGEVGNSSDGAGHVAVVEMVHSNNIVTSESDWSAKQEFWTQTRRNDGNWGQGTSYRFLSFILPPQTASVKALRKGDKGDAVRALQTALADAGYLRRTEIDGDFGVITLGAVLAFQLEHGLKVDGIAGPETQAALKI